MRLGRNRISEICGTELVLLRHGRNMRTNAPGKTLRSISLIYSVTRKPKEIIYFSELHTKKSNSTRAASPVFSSILITEVFYFTPTFSPLNKDTRNKKWALKCCCTDVKSSLLSSNFSSAKFFNIRCLKELL